MAHWTNRKVVRAWVNHNQRGRETNYAQTANIGFRGPMLFSYGSAIACYHTGPTKKLFVLISKAPERKAGKWPSVNHRSLAQIEISVPSFYVTDINPDNNPKVHENNLVQMYADFSSAQAECIEKFKKGEGELTDSWRTMLSWHHERICRYIDVAGIDSCPPELEGRLDHVRYERMKRWRSWMDPRDVARRERAAAKRMARQLILGENK